MSAPLAYRLGATEFITDPATVLTHIGRREVQLYKGWPLGGVNRVQHTLWLRVPRRLIRHLVGAGLVQPHGLGWSAGSWVYRLTELGERHVRD